MRPDDPRKPYFEAMARRTIAAMGPEEYARFTAAMRLKIERAVAEGVIERVSLDSDDPDYDKFRMDEKAWDFMLNAVREFGGHAERRRESR